MQGQRTCERIEATQAHVERQAGLTDRAHGLDRIDRDPDEFVFIVSHDLKEPLHGVRAYCGLLLEDYQDKLGSDGRRRLNALAETCDRLCASIDSLLAYCRVGQARRPDEPVDLNAVVDGVLHRFRPTIDARRASVSVVGPLPVVQGDAVLIGEVLGNLVSNGLKFNRSEAPHVEIGLLAGDVPTIYVRDNGIGIAREYHQEIFTIFRRLHSRREYEGCGAGLTIVRKIVESHGGRVWLESEPGRGTTFFFTLGPAPSDAPGAKPPTRPPHWVRRAKYAPGKPAG